MNGPDPADEWTAMVVVGRIARAHGRWGEVVVNPETDFPEQRFRSGATVFMRAASGPRLLKILEARIQGGRPVVRLEGVETMGAADALAGEELRIRPSDQHALPAGSYYTRALLGCEVRTVDARSLGVVTDVQAAGGAGRLIVQSAETGAEIDIPLAEPICVRIDTTARVIVVDPPDGLIELNERA